MRSSAPIGGYVTKRVEENSANGRLETVHVAAVTRERSPDIYSFGILQGGKKITREF